jgi:hypothetical protein
MARQQVEKIQCDRCRRGELRPIDTNAQEPRSADFEASFLGQKLVYADLCGECRETVKNIWDELSQWTREVKRMVVKLNGDQAAPLQTAPNYSPPQPHSGAAAKR